MKKVQSVEGGDGPFSDGGSQSVTKIGGSLFRDQVRGSFWHARFSSPLFTITFCVSLGQGVVNSK